MTATVSAAATDADLARWAKALGHPARLAILRTLGAQGTCVCGEVVEVVGLAQSTVSQHLKVLREAGLVRGTPDGTRSCYCLDGGGVAAASAALGGLLDGLHACCDGACC
ncbi:metalloregulator ArsR/SmtB family transcription factor [Rubrivirga sp. S365]|uniref:Metalloregulator ArsR/SmtB family transcription factor n=1 Tax=Rubrivirga litoralis TaxID=3075598 RepID=A0ABU3BN82_9BACT|nr:MULTISPECIES: metalloregulator ArsR/SmtB family transcription factor [unclassified Rubrivirga]MDT0630680.1 metalloregulator ArsR/SmtB family transcription factor [Rubrivirga sp. F394]MDT7856253.1 metalloregulator ArsR/SmtB family transcription factor [Rubrivirga sp. S365]